MKQAKENKPIIFFHKYLPTSNSKLTVSAWMVAMGLLMAIFPLHSQNTVAYLRTASLAEAAPAFEWTAPTGQRIPFKLIRGMILTEASIDQEKGRFILDTGAPLLVVNDRPDAPSRLAASFSQEIQVGETTIENFRWAGLEEKKLEALVLDISHLESAFGQSLEGMIGYNVLKDYEVYFDYENSFMLRSDPRKNVLHDHAEPLYSIPFQLSDHLPVITVTIGKRKLRLGLDTGACANLIDVAALEALDAGLITWLPDEEVQGLDQNVKRVQALQLDHLEAKELAVSDLKFLSADLSQLHSEDGVALDGLLGYAFLSRFKFSINYPKGRIYVWE